jgi:hypothetical protein
MNTALITKVDNHLKLIGHISAREAMSEYQIICLRDVIYRLRKKGHVITTEQRVNPITFKRYVRYRRG